MTHVSLYRKYRPASFKDVIGQDHVVAALEGALKKGTLSHAYLFHGSRGTGKTSVARIFAKAAGVSANDLYEIDAASNTGVDDIRALNEAVNTLPLESLYKVYIIDEVHMLSKSAFNALLKTLEEPPKHVIFILATTEMEKLPETVVSRCQTFSFKKPTVTILTEVVERLAKKEGYSLDRSSAELIALLGDGSFRDTQGMLEKVISSSPTKRISHDEVEKITGAPQASVVNTFILALNAKNINAGIEALEVASRSNIDMNIFLRLVMMKVRSIVLLKYAPTLKQNLKDQFSDADYCFIIKLSESNDLNLGSKTLIKLIEAAEIEAYAVEPSLPLELALITHSE